ncbi:ABC transporter permease subunit, partial [Rhizobium ruizarguesonis]
ISNSAIEAARYVGAVPLRLFISIILPRMVNSLLVTASFAVLGIFSAFTLPYLLGSASPEMMWPFMQRTFADMNDPLNAMTQAVITFGFCLICRHSRLGLAVAGDRPDVEDAEDQA